jgi:hypothetical protein
VAELPDDSPDPLEAAWQRQRVAELRSAFAALTPPQREALGLAYFDGLSHQEVAARLRVPLGTAKTRIRAGLQQLRGRLTPLVAAAALVGLLASFGVRYQSDWQAYQRDERALALVTSSDTQAIRVTAAPGVSDETHGVYRGQPGAAIAVMTFSSFTPPASGLVYQAWVLHGATWTSLGTFTPAADGHARLIAEGSDLATMPDAIRVTLEPASGSPTPSGPTLIAWPVR